MHAGNDSLSEYFRSSFEREHNRQLTYDTAVARRDGRRYSTPDPKVLQSIRELSKLRPYYRQQLPIMLGSKPRNSQIKGVRVSTGVVETDVGVGEMLIPISNRDSLARFAEDLNAPAKINRVHELRTLRRQHPIAKVDSSAIRGEERLHPAVREKRRAKANRAYSASIGSLSLRKTVLRGWIDLIQHGQGCYFR